MALSLMGIVEAQKPVWFIVGAVLANTSRRRGRLGPAIFIHAGFNLVAILAVLFTPELVAS